MDQSKAAGRTVRVVRRAALTSLGAGLVLGAAAPIASAATTNADGAPLSSPVPTADSASASVPVAAPDLASAPVAAPDLASAPVAAPAFASAPGLADSALRASTAGLTGAVGANWSRLGHFKLYPLAGTGVDPLSNVVSTSLGGIPVSTAPVSRMVADGLPVNDLPVVGSLLGAPHAS